MQTWWRVIKQLHMWELIKSYTLCVPACCFSPSFPPCSIISLLFLCIPCSIFPFQFFPWLHNFHHLLFLLSSSVLYLSLLTGSVALRRFRLSNSSLSMKVLSMSPADSCQSRKHSAPWRQMSCTAFGVSTVPSGRRTNTVGTSFTLNMACSSLRRRNTELLDYISAILPG